MKNPILLVEDDPNDVLFMQIALKNAGVETPLHIASDGRKALDYLHLAMQSTDLEAHPLPSMILLDLRLPQLTGDEVLRWIREQPSGRDLPVIILTSSNAETDIEKAYQLGANSYMVKPVNPAELKEIAKLIRDYWLTGKQTQAEVDHFSLPVPHA